VYGGGKAAFSSKKGKPLSFPASKRRGPKAEFYETNESDDTISYFRV
jgi:hypothetical protein